MSTKESQPADNSPAGTKAPADSDATPGVSPSIPGLPDLPDALPKIKIPDLPFSIPGLTSPDEEPILLDPKGAWRSKQRRWIPSLDDTEAHPNRTLVICFDGTGDRFDDDNSNVVQLVSLLRKDDHAHQMVYYQTGIGTDTESKAFRNTSKAVDLMFAVTLGYHVRNGYEFLVQNYRDGDVICIFGFSRGAYTARALAGMVQKVGVLPPWNRQMIPFAYHMFSKTDADTLGLCQGFKQTFSTDVKIEFVGVWDTVASVGLVPRYLPFVTSNNSIRYFRHALALDEHRVKFAPSYYRPSRNKGDKGGDDQAGWEPQTRTAPKRGQLVENTTVLPAGHPRSPTEKTYVESPLENPSEKPLDKGEAGRPSPRTQTSAKKATKKEGTVNLQYETMINATTGQRTDSVEVWFPGVHTDVGGGSVPNHTRHSLARIPLRWMIRECFRCNTGLIFDADMLREEVGMDIDMKAWKVMEAPERLSPGDLYRLRTSPMHPLVSIAKGLYAAATTPGQFLTRATDALLNSASTSTDDKPQRGHTREPFKGEAMEELLDALSPMYDQLHLSPPWWALEWVPLSVKKEKAIYESTSDLDSYKWLVNGGDGRKIFKYIVHRGMNVHRSVLSRLEARDEKGQYGSYIPNVRPNIVVKKEGKEEHLQFRTMTHQEWLTRSAEKLGHPWFEWV